MRNSVVAGKQIWNLPQPQCKGALKMLRIKRWLISILVREEEGPKMLTYELSAPLLGLPLIF